MKRNHQLMIIGCCALMMSSCAMLDDSTGQNLTYPAYASYDNSQLYMQHNYNLPNYNYKYDASSRVKQEVVVPDSYHVGELRSPVSFQDRDHNWVSSQNPQSYTIELTEGDRPAKVAQVLYKAPKTERMAQMKYQRGGKDYYRGVYGSYSSAAEAQKALESLPPEIRKGASVKTWGSMQ